ncbi:hypothetical protein BDR26DRAFT_866721 [Obelidium mucronatum]|nr:hypothetical protein BDR26DRAFT_866721 [Obelidium mucronatum]
MESTPSAPQTKRGRKPTATTGNDPNSKRAMQLREAQRMHQQRKAQYVKDLEQRVHELMNENKELKYLKEKVEQLELDCHLLKSKNPAIQSLLSTAVSSNRTCDSCHTNMIKLQTQLDAANRKCNELQSKLDQSRVQDDLFGWTESIFTGSSAITIPPPLPPLSISKQSPDNDYIMDDLDSFLNGIRPRLISAEEIFGPCDVELLRLSLKLIPSLSESELIDSLMDLITAHTQSTDLITSKRIILKRVRIMGQLFQRCAISERAQFFNAISSQVERNINHVKYLVQVWSSYLPHRTLGSSPTFRIYGASPDPKKYHPDSSSHSAILDETKLPLLLRTCLQQFKSLQDYQDLVEEFVYSLTKGIDRDDPETLFRVNLSVGKLAVAANVADRADLLMLVHEIRDGHQDIVEEMIAKAQELTLA